MRRIDVSRYEFVPAKLIQYGFTPTDETYVLRKGLEDSTFEVVICYQADNLEVEVYDIEAETPYYLYSVDDAVGAAVLTIKAEVEQLLDDIVAKCCVPSNAVAQVLTYVKMRYNSDPKHPFSRHPEHIGFSIPMGKKWYGIILAIPYQRLDRASQDTRVVHVLNVKHSPQNIPQLIDHQQIFPAYHMNKKHWVSILLDSNVDSTLVESLIDESYQLVTKRK